MKKITIQLETLACPSCSLKIEGAVKKLDGVEKESVEVLFNSSRVRMNFDENKLAAEEIEKSISALGYEVVSSKVR